MSNYDGQRLVYVIVNRLEDTNNLINDREIVAQLRKMTKRELDQVFGFGDVLAWNNDRRNLSKTELYNL